MSATPSFTSSTVPTSSTSSVPRSAAAISLRRTSFSSPGRSTESVAIVLCAIGWMPFRSQACENSHKSGGPTTRISGPTRGRPPEGARDDRLGRQGAEGPHPRTHQPTAAALQQGGGGVAQQGRHLRDPEPPAAEELPRRDQADRVHGRL